jgi:hypothetical protein
MSAERVAELRREAQAIRDGRWVDSNPTPCPTLQERTSKALGDALALFGFLSDEYDRVVRERDEVRRLHDERENSGAVAS